MGLLAFVWWKRGYMPAWYAGLIPLSALVFVCLHRAGRAPFGAMMGGPIIVLGIAQVVWGPRMIQAEAQRVARMPAFYRGSSGLLVARLVGLLFVGVGVATILVKL
jgi:hypothetical protein